MSIRVKLRARASAPILCVAMGVALHAEPARADETGKGPTVQIQEVVVTATRRETTVQRTPAAISVLSGALQRDRGEQGLADLQTSAPNVNFNATSNVSQIYIRGIGNTFINAGGDPGVAFYQDGAYVSDQTATNTSLFDVDRVEVLRGPQGALFGRNAVGGAINIISAKPTDHFEGRIDGVLGDYGRRETEGYLSGPLGFAATDFRIAYQVKHRDGYVKNLLAGQPGAPRDLDNLDSQAFRIQTLTTLPTGGKVGLIFNDYHEGDNGAALAVEPYNNNLYPVQAIFGVAPGSNPRATQANVGSYGLDVLSLNLGYVQPLGADTLTVTGNWRESRQTYLNDCDGTAQNGCTYYRHTFGQDYFADIHLASPNDQRFRWLVGATFLRFNQPQLNIVPFASLCSYFAAGASASCAFPIHTYTGGRITTTSYAAYVNLRFQLTRIWALHGEARYTETEKDALETAIVPEFGESVINAPNRLKNSSEPFKVGLEGQLSRTILVYADYATAQKDGAINLGALQASSIKPETVRAEEIGVKSTFLDRRLQINAALFNSDYDNLQISQLVGVNVALANAPRSNIKGAELEIVALPARGLQLTFNGGYLDARFNSFANSETIPGLAGGPLLNLAGRQLSYVSPVTLNFDVAYKAPPIGGLVPSIDLQYSWHDRIYFNEFNDANNSQGPVGLVNLSAAIAPQRGPWRLYAFVHNLTDQTVISGTTIYAGILGAERAVSFSPPRNFGVGASFSF